MVNAEIKPDLSLLKPLQDKIKKRILKKAIRAGAAIVRNDLKQTAPKSTGTLRQSIAVKVDSVRGQTTTYGVIGPRSKFEKVVNGQKKKPSRYAHFIEVGKYKTPFLVPAWNKNRSAYLNKVQEVISTEVTKELG